MTLLRILAVGDEKKAAKKEAAPKAEKAEGEAPAATKAPAKKAAAPKADTAE
jgi:hypothetical protein